MKHTILSSKRGAPRVNKLNRKGNVRVTIALPNSEGNMTRSLTFINTTVADVLKTITATGTVITDEQNTQKVQKPQSETK